MKGLNELVLPEDLRYSTSHEWARAEPGGRVRIGISDYAQDQMGDIVFVDLPEEGIVLAKGDELGTVESVKAVAEIYAPVAGSVAAVNKDLSESPELVNKDPYGRGWMVELEGVDEAELDALMSRVDYLAGLDREED
ncbi:MAG: glycine cleavage system protein GcvH [Desulfobacteraceae bacterium]